VGIIDRGQLAGLGSIAELCERVGLPEDASLEEVFVRTVGVEENEEAGRLDWLTGGEHDVA
jgi:hypothetical protein